MIVERHRLGNGSPPGFATWGSGSSSVISGRYTRISEDVFEAGTSILEEVRQLSRMLAEVRHLAALTSGRSEEELPEVLDLQPASRRKVVFQVLRRTASPFRLAWEPDEPSEPG